MTDDRHKLWDAIIKAIGALGIVAGAILGLWQYNATTEKEFKQKFWEKQLSLYIDASQAASTLATIPKIENDALRKAEREKAHIRFWQLYYGELSLVEDKEVESAMVDFGNCLRQYELDNCEPQELRSKSLKLASVLRDSIRQSWTVRLDELRIDTEEGRATK